VFTYHRFRMIMMIVGIISTLYYTYEALGAGLIMLSDFGDWLKETFK
jgi:hypothetical protein